MSEICDFWLVCTNLNHKSNVIDDCNNSCATVIVLSDTFEEIRELMYYL